MGTRFETLASAAGPTSSAGIRPGLAVAVGGAAVSVVVSRLVPSVSTLVVAVVIGAAIGNSGLGIVSEDGTARPGLTFAARRLLRAGVVLLGLRLSLGDVAQLGSRTLLVVGSTVILTFFGTQLIGRRLGVSPDLSLLVATGFSICGASAIAAIESSTEAEEDEVAAAIGLVTLFGTLAIFALPVLAARAGLSDDQFGVWAGASVHDVAQVAATASAGGASVVATAMVVKLTRVVLLAPIVIGVNLQRRSGRGASSGSRPPILPLFVVGFVGMVVVRTSGLLPDGVVLSMREVEGWMLAAALVGLGSGVRLQQLRRLGARPLVLGLLAWILVAATSYLGLTAGIGG